MQKSTKLIFVSLIASAFVGCGGSGSSTPDTTSGLNFPSNAVIAEPTLDNGKKVRDAVVGSQNVNSNSFILNSVDDNSKNIDTTFVSNNILMTLHKYIEYKKSYSLNEVINETENCSGGGTISAQGNENVGDSAYATVSFDNCIENNIKMNGKMYITANNYDNNVDEYKNYNIDFTTDFTAINLSDNSTLNVKKGSNISEQVIDFDEYESPKDYKVLETIQGTYDGKSFGEKDCEFYATLNQSNGKLKIYQTKGRVYIDNLASYVDYDANYDMSKTPFVYNLYDYSLESGEARYNMANNGKVKIVVESNEPKVYVDANGDGNYELHD